MIENNCWINLKYIDKNYKYYKNNIKINKIKLN